MIRSAVDADAFAARPDCAAFRDAYGIPGEALVIAAAGQLIPRKGHRYLLQAVSELRRGGTPVRVVLFGEGYLANQLRAQVQALGLGDTVQFAGFREDLDEWLGCFDVLVHPALAEGLGVVTLKAAAAGVPVVGFAAGGLPEAVVHGETGLLVPPGDAAALRDALEGLIDDPERRRALGAAGRKRMQNEFSVATMADRHIALYGSVADGR